MRARLSLLLASSLVASVAAGCGGSSHGAAQTGTVSNTLVLLPSDSHTRMLSPAARAALNRLAKSEGENPLTVAHCYRLVRDPRTHKLTAKPRKHC